MATPDRVVTPRTPMADVEDRIGIPPLEGLLAERDDMVREAAPLWAKYGPGEVWSHHRKSILSTLELEWRARLEGAGKKVTDASASAAAHADPRYTDELVRALEERAKLFALQNRIDNIGHLIMRGNVLASFAKSEARL